jgi:hypothetical protein
MKKILKFLSFLICSCILIISLINVHLNDSSNLSTKIRNVELSNQDLDYQEIFSEFDNAKFYVNNNLATFSGNKTYNLTDIIGIDYVSISDIEEKVDVKYVATYNDLDTSVSLTATIDIKGEEIEDTIYGTAFIDENGNPDAFLNLEDTIILLSDINNITLIENCGWFKK